jgi:hypothetical protein
MRQIISLGVVVGNLVLLTACSEPQKVWIVMEFKGKNGEKGQMAFDNPSVPDMTLEECLESLEDALPNLLNAAYQQPELPAGAEYVGVECVVSETDPLAPSE